MAELRNKRILVTGADGFIGSHLVETLLNEGCKVRAFVYYNSFNSWGWLDSFDKKTLEQVEVVAGDVRDQGSVKGAMKGIEAVFHLAALIAIPYSYNAPESYIDTNIKGTLNILQASREYDLERVFVTSTSEVYGTAMQVPISENHPMQGQSPYSASKIGADRIAESFYRSFGLPVTIVRPFNTYGPRQSARAIIPTVITQLLAGNGEISIGALTPTRDFTYVKDTCKGFIDIWRSDKTIGEEINIATGKEISIKDLAQNIIEIIDPKARVVVDNDRLRPPASEVERLLGSNEKISRLTNWKASYSLKEGLLETIEWIKVNLDRYKPNVYNI